jgi:hypothetical protein
MHDLGKERLLLMLRFHDMNAENAEAEEEKEKE